MTAPLPDPGLVLTTDRLTLRAREVGDAVVMRELWLERDPRVPAHRRIDGEGRPTLHDIEQTLFEAPGLLTVVERESGEVLGYCGLVSSDRGPELAFELLQRVHGRGVATEAARAVLGWAAAAGHERIWATVWDWNAPSRRVLAKLGFTEVEPGPSLVMALDLHSTQLPAERAQSFGAVAEDYERFRLGYPDAVVDLIEDYADTPLHTAVEIGWGTGKATRPFVTRGLSVTASDLDPAMLAVLRRRLPGVPTLCATLEDLTLSQPVDLVFAAASLHWTDPQGRWERIAALLRPRGVFASFGRPRDLADPELDAAVSQAVAPWLRGDDLPPALRAEEASASGQVLRWPATELTRSSLFTDVRQIELPQSELVSREWYAGHLGTVSAYLQLPASERAAALAAVRSVLPDEVEVAGELTLHLARRLS